jgi:hypothetical protein
VTSRQGYFNQTPKSRRNRVNAATKERKHSETAHFQKFKNPLFDIGIVCDGTFISYQQCRPKTSYRADTRKSAAFKAEVKSQITPAAV